MDAASDAGRRVVRAWRALRLLLSFIWRLTWAPLSLLLIAVMGLASVWALLHDGWVSEQVVRGLPGVTVVQPRGAVLGDFAADRIEVALPRGGQLVWQQPAWKTLRVVIDRSAPWFLGVQVDEISGQRIDVSWAPDPSPAVNQAPTDLSLPVSITIGRLQLAELHGLTGSQPLRRLDAEARIGAMRHSVRVRSLAWTDWVVSGSLGLGGQGEMPVEVDLTAKGGRPTVRSAEDVLEGHGEITLRARGPLRDLALQLGVNWQPKAGALQTAAADVRVQPFAAWAVPKGRLDLMGLDLAALWPALPRSAIKGHIVFDDSTTSDLVAHLDLRNGMAGAWNLQRLPVSGVIGKLAIERALISRASADAWRELRTDLTVTMPGRTGQRPARLLFKGPLMGRAPLTVQVQDLAPRALLESLPDLELTGDLRLTPTASAAGASGALDMRLAGWVHEVAGRLLKKPVSLRMGSQLSSQKWFVQSLQLTSGDAMAQFDEMTLRWGLAPQQGRWALAGRMRLERFDPRAWLPWPVALNGSTILNGSGRFDVDGAGAGAAEWALTSSSLAGVPLAAQGTWAAPRSARDVRLDVQATVGGNRVSLQGQAQGAEPSSSSAGLSGAWQLQVQAPDLASLSPWVLPLGADRLQGQLSLDARGAWPLQALRYRMQARDVTASRDEQPVWQVAEMDGEGDFNLLQEDGPVAAKWALQGVRVPGWLLSRLTLGVDGSTAAHRIQIDGEGSPLVEGDVDASRAVRLALGVAGRWRGDSLAQAWQARLSDAQLNWVQPRGRPALLRIEPTDVSWRSGAKQSEWQVAATRLQGMGLQGQLDRLVWRTPAGASDVDALREFSVVLPPFQVAPWLALWQPDQGWSGDLVAGAQLKLIQRGKQPPEVDFQVERRSGDLLFSEPGIEGGRAQRLGLREARFTLRARQGVWTAEQLIDGRRVGLLRGRQVVQPLNASAWPDLSATLFGEVRLDVADLRALGAWMPAGWRLGGKALAQARLSGTLGEPLLTGQVVGSGLSASQALMGINLQDASLQMDLDGERVRLTRLDASGGAQGGSVAAEGELRLSSPLVARLSLKMDRFAALQRIDRRLVASGRVDATLTDWQMSVSGQVGVDEGFIDISRGSAPTLGGDVNVINRPGEVQQLAGSAVKRDGSGATSKQLTVDANIGVDLGEQLRLRGHGLSGLLKGQVRVSTPRNKPAINGVVRLDQGKFAAYGQKLDIVRSTIAFNGLIEDPRLDILAMRPQTLTAQDSDVKVGVSITGSAQTPRIRLYSEPALSETEQLSWLILGRGPTGLGGADIGLLQSAAVALLSGDDGPALTDQLIGLLGLDTLSVSQSDGVVRETVVSVGKQLSKHWYAGYERNLSATGGNWQLVYSLARRFKVRAQAGEDNAIDFIWQWRRR